MYVALFKGTEFYLGVFQGDMVSFFLDLSLPLGVPILTTYMFVLCGRAAEPGVSYHIQ